MTNRIISLSAAAFQELEMALEPTERWSNTKLCDEGTLNYMLRDYATGKPIIFTVKP